ncbi:hypothetical protein CRUP_030342 [Coryphaenoides rupestris]|nr:hypothetical protein CRUP_030342 [Coryphaenoides rupestris]
MLGASSADHVGVSGEDRCVSDLGSAAQTDRFGFLLTNGSTDGPALQSWVDIIERDLDRQFPFHEMFVSKDGHGQRGLFRVLKAYTQFQPDEGYCQAQGPVAAMLLMNMPAEEAFWCLVQISEQYLPGYYSQLLDGVLFDSALLSWVLKRTCPPAHRHLQHYGVEPLMFATDWLMCLFTRHLPFNTLLHVWDLFFCYGVRVLFQVAVVLVRRVLGRSEQRQECLGQMETLERLRGVRDSLGPEDDARFMAEVCSVPLSRSDLKRRTKKELEKWREDRPSSTFDPSGRCQGYWALQGERDQKGGFKGNLSIPLVRSASTLSLSPSLLRKRRQGQQLDNQSQAPEEKQLEDNNQSQAPEEQQVEDNNQSQLSDEQELEDSDQSHVSEDQELEGNNQSKVSQEQELEDNNQSQAPEEQRVEDNNQSQAPEEQRVEDNNQSQAPEEQQVEDNKQSQVSDEQELEESDQSHVSEDQELEGNNQSKVSQEQELEDNNQSQVPKEQQLENNNQSHVSEEQELEGNNQSQVPEEQKCNSKQNQKEEVAEKHRASQIISDQNPGRPKLTRVPSQTGRDTTPPEALSNQPPSQGPPGPTETTGGTGGGACEQRLSPKRPGFFSRLRGAQRNHGDDRKAGMVTTPPKIQVPKIFIQNSSDGLEEERPLAAVEEEQLSSRERRRRQRERERKEKEEEKVRKRMEKELKKTGRKGLQQRKDPCPATHQSNVTDTRPQVSSSLSLANTFWLAIVRLLSGEPVGYTEPKNRDRNCERKAAQKQWQGSSESVAKTKFPSNTLSVTDSTTGLNDVNLPIL